MFLVRTDYWELLDRFCPTPAHHGKQNNSWPNCRRRRPRIAEVFLIHRVASSNRNAQTQACDVVQYLRFWPVFSAAPAKPSRCCQMFPDQNREEGKLSRSANGNPVHEILIRRFVRPCKRTMRRGKREKTKATKKVLWSWPCIK